MFSDCLERGQVGLGLAANVIIVQSLLLEFVRKCSEHALQNFRHNLHVKEESIGIFAVAEGLARCQIGGSEIHSTFGRLKNISMPVVSGESSVEVTGCHPISFSRPFLTSAPSAAASNWLPRQTPRMGFDSRKAHSIKLISSRRKG